MIARKLVWLLASCAFIVSCGGGDSSAPPPTGGTPTPTPSPTPTPTPTPSYVAFNEFDKDVDFDTSCNGYYRPAPGDAPVSLTDLAFGSGLPIGYRAATDSYVVTGQELEYIFGPEDRRTSSDGRSDIYSEGVDLTLTLGPRDAEYARSMFLLAVSNAIPYQIVECVLGVPTQPGDLPEEDRSYETLLLGGSASRNSMSYDLSASTVNASYDANGKTISLRVGVAGRRTSYSAGEPEDPNVYTLGEFEGTASVTGSESSFLGSISSPVSSEVTGSFGGSLFGPRGQEVALAFKFGGSGSDGARFSGRGTLVMRAAN